MKQYIPHCQNCSHKIPLGTTFVNRTQLRYSWGNTFNIECPSCHSVNTYSSGDIYAESDSNAKVGGGIIGGLVGLLGGPLGLFLGAGIGTLIGNAGDSDDQKKVSNFNSSY